MNNSANPTSPNRDVEEVELPPREPAPSAPTAWLDTEESGPVNVLPGRRGAEPAPVAANGGDSMSAPVEQLLTGDTDEMEIPIFADGSEPVSAGVEPVAAADSAAHPSAAADNGRPRIATAASVPGSYDELDPPWSDSAGFAGDSSATSDPWLEAAARGARAASSAGVPGRSASQAGRNRHRDPVAVIPANGPSTSRTALWVTGATVVATVLAIWFALGSLEGASPRSSQSTAAAAAGSENETRTADSTILAPFKDGAEAVVEALADEDVDENSATAAAVRRAAAEVEARQAPALGRHSGYATASRSPASAQANRAPADRSPASESDSAPAPSGNADATRGGDSTSGTPPQQREPAAEVRADIPLPDLDALDKPLIRRTGELSAEVIVPFSGDATDAVAYKLRDGRSAAVNLPPGIETVARRDYTINRDGVVFVWIRPRQSGGTHIRVIAGTRVRENRIVVRRDHLRFELEFSE